MRCDSSTGPVSNPASICIRHTPVSVSPASIARWIGAAPRQRGSNEACTFQQPCVGAASTAFGKINPYATTTIRSASSARNVANASGERSVCGWKTGMPRAIASSLTGEGVNPRPRPAGRSGCVYTATTSCRCAAARSDGTAKSGVPAKMILIGLGFGIREWGVATAGVLAGARMAWS